MNHFDTVRDLISLTLGVPPEQVTPETAQAELSAWDSVGQLNLMLALEDAFQTTLSVDEMRSLTSVPNILNHLAATCPSR